METFHLYHLAACWGGGSNTSAKSADPPLATGPVSPVASLLQSPTLSTTLPHLASPDTVIRAAAAQMVFASRTSQGFITPDQVTEVERWTGLVRYFFRNPTLWFTATDITDNKGVLNALINLEIPAEVRVPVTQSLLR